MAISVCEASITRSPLELPVRADDPEAGALVVFWGAVRATEGGRPITGIEYEAHPAMAEYQLQAVAENAAKKFDVREISIRHRTGFVPVSEASVVVRVTSGHRSAAFAASEWIIDELKRVVPIWKHPVFQEEGPASVNPAAQRSDARV